MEINIKRSCIGALMTIIWLTPAWGHHSHSNYQLLEYTQLTGTVVEMRWMNPHTWIYLEVTGEDGVSSLSAVEGGSPNALTNNGWGPDILQPGDEISVRCHRLRDGGSSCLLGFVTFPDGEERRGFITPAGG